MPSRISSELDHLARIARDGGLDLSQVSLRVQADLLMSMPNPPQEDLATFSELALALLPAVDDATATILARKLAGWRHAPPPVLAALMARGGDVLVALLRHGMPLPASELETLAVHGDEATATALAERGDLTAAAMLMLAARDMRVVDLALIANGTIRLPRSALDLLLSRARADAAYAPGLLSRGDLSGAEIAPLFLQAGASQRSTILDALGAIEALGPSERRGRLSAEVFASWIATAEADRDGAFGAIAAFLGFGPVLATAMTSDRSRELAALALVAAGTSVEDATRFLIRLGDENAHSVERIFALVTVMRATRPEVAARLLSQIDDTRQDAPVRRGRHQPAMDPTGSPLRGGEKKADARSVLGQVRKLDPRRGQG